MREGQSESEFELGVVERGVSSEHGEPRSDLVESTLLRKFAGVGRDEPADLLVVAGRHRVGDGRADVACFLHDDARPVVQAA